MYIHSFVTWHAFMKWDEMYTYIYTDKHICDDMLEYEVIARVHEWPYESVHYGECDAGSEESVLVCTGPLLSLWLICEVLVNTWARQAP